MPLLSLFLARFGIFRAHPRARIFAELCGCSAFSAAMLLVSCPAGNAQDTDRPPANIEAAASVDASVRAGVDEQAAQPPEPSRQTSKPPKYYSRWGFQPAKAAPATRFRPAKPADLAAQNSAVAAAGDDDRAISSSASRPQDRSALAAPRSSKSGSVSRQPLSASTDYHVAASKVRSLPEGGSANAAPQPAPFAGSSLTPYRNNAVGLPGFKALSPGLFPPFRSQEPTSSRESPSAPAATFPSPFSATLGSSRASRKSSSQKKSQKSPAGTQSSLESPAAKKN